MKNKIQVQDSAKTKKLDCPDDRPKDKISRQMTPEEDSLFFDQWASSDVETTGSIRRYRSLIKMESSDD